MAANLAPDLLLVIPRRWLVLSSAMFGDDSYKHISDKVFNSDFINKKLKLRIN